jgi:hypothetical protein
METPKSEKVIPVPERVLRIIASKEALDAAVDQRIIAGMNRARAFEATVAEVHKYIPDHRLHYSDWRSYWVIRNKKYRDSRKKAK